MSDIADILTTSTALIALVVIAVPATHAVVRPHALGIRMLVSSCLMAALLVGCGNDSTDDGAANRATGSSSEPSNPPATQADTLAVPSGGPKKIKEFPIPQGAKIVDIGPAYNLSWQFGISSPNTTAVLAFYKDALVERGYTVREKATQSIGANRVERDLAFFGKTYGIVDADESIAGGTLISVNDNPLQGLER